MSWGVAWLVYLGAVALGFTWLEYKAVQDPDAGDTLSENIRAWFRVRDKGTKGRIGRLVFLFLIACFPLWFSLHILVPGFV